MPPFSIPFIFDCVLVGPAFSDTRKDGRSSRYLECPARTGLTSSVARKHHGFGDRCFITYESNLLLGLTKAPGPHVLGRLLLLSFVHFVQLQWYWPCRVAWRARFRFCGSGTYVQVPYLGTTHPSFLKSFQPRSSEDLEVGAVLHRHRHMVLRSLAPSVLQGIFRP